MSDQNDLISRAYVRKMAMLEPNYTMETLVDKETLFKLIADAPPPSLCRSKPHGGSAFSFALGWIHMSKRISAANAERPFNLVNAQITVPTVAAKWWRYIKVRKQNDLIRRDRLINKSFEVELPGEFTMVVRLRDILNAPAVTPPERTGRWLNFANDYSTAECSKCGEVYEVSPEEEPREEYFNAFKQLYKYCPNCGCKNLEGDEHETD